MTRVQRFAAAAAAAALTCGATLASGQTLAERIARAPDGPVQFSFPARPGVCGDGRTFIRVSHDSYAGSIYVGNGMTDIPCVAGPVRVIIDRAGRTPLGIQAFVGGADTTTAIANVGRVRGQEAADYLLNLASTVDGRAGRDAILPALLADSASVTDKLLGIAHDRDLPRETRRTALSWIARSVEGTATVPAAIPTQLASLARDDSDNLQVRQAALGVLSRLEHGAGIPALETLSRDAPSAWLQKEATLALARSGDPRAREDLRAIVRRTDLPEEVLVAAIHALGQEYATAQDAALLRDLYPKLTSDRTRDAVMTSIAELGGSDNVRWLLALAASPTESLANRRRALEAANRGGAPITDLVKLYDTTTDPQMKDALVSVYVRSGEPAAIDKVLAILKDESDVVARRRVISRLSQSDDPRIRRALEDLVVR